MAQLYEYWAFLQLAKAVTLVTSQPLDWERLVSHSQDGLTLHFGRGQESLLRGQSRQRNRLLHLQLWFNRTFRRPLGSWSSELRPDCSLEISGEGLPTPVVVHFDAKYRLEGNPLSQAEVRQDDLLKMHAYRDAIRHSGGAYVLFPGTESRLVQQYCEFLPGLGAFPLTPSESGRAAGSQQLVEFLTSLLTHCAEQFSLHERSRYWQHQTYSGPNPPPRGLPQYPFLSRPPEDTPVLLGYVRSAEQRHWIASTGLYNLRADERRGAISLHSRHLAAEFVLAYDRQQAQIFRVQGAPRLYTREKLLQTGYPRPGGDLYLCLPIEPILHPLNFPAPRLAQLFAQFQGTPQVQSWSWLAAELLG